MSNAYKPIKLKTAIKIDQLYSLHYFTYSKRFSFEGEQHDFWELIYCDSGEAKIVDNENEFMLVGGEAFLHAPNHFHTVKPNNTQTNVVIVSFNGSLSQLPSGTVLQLDKEDKALLKTIIQEGRNTFSEPLNLVYQYELKPTSSYSALSLCIIKCSLELLLLKMCKKKPAVTQTNLTHNQGIAMQIIDILQHRVNERVTLQQLSQMLCYSVAYLKQTFKAEQGCGIIQYFNKLKIMRAKQLLVETNLTVTEISEQLGFDTPQYFSRLFKLLTNMTPTAYQGSVTSGVL